MMRYILMLGMAVMDGGRVRVRQREQRRNLPPPHLGTPVVSHVMPHRRVRWWRRRRRQSRCGGAASRRRRWRFPPPGSRRRTNHWIWIIVHHSDSTSGRPP